MICNKEKKQMCEYFKYNKKQTFKFANFGSNFLQNDV